MHSFNDIGYRSISMNVCSGRWVRDSTVVAPVSEQGFGAFIFAAAAFLRCGTTRVQAFAAEVVLGFDAVLVAAFVHAPTAAAAAVLEPRALKPPRAPLRALDSAVRALELSALELLPRTHVTIDSIINNDSGCRGAASPFDTSGTSCS